MRLQRLTGDRIRISTVALCVATFAAAALVATLATTANAAPAASTWNLDDDGRAATAVSPVDQPLRAGEFYDHLPPPRSTGARSDTIDFGFYEIRDDGLKYAVRGGLWTWDHGASDPLEGWTSIDLTTNDREYWRGMSAATWLAEGNPGPWPQMNASAGIALCGASEAVADTLLWLNGLGYGNHWCQRLVSPAFTYAGSGSVDLSFHYFNETEAEYDYSKVILVQGSMRTLLNGPGFNGRIGIDEFGTITQQPYARTIDEAEFSGGPAPQEFRVVVEFESDGGLSDEDGSSGWDAFYGALGLDDVVLDGTNLQPPLTRQFDFEDGLQGWTAERCPGVGSFLGVASFSQYAIADPCQCLLAGNVLELHDDLQQHPGDPNGQHELAESPICDLAADIGDPAYLDYNRILAEWDMYVTLPQADGVFFRARWSYYPYENPNIPGLMQWSPRVGQATYLGWDSYGCVSMRNVATDWGFPPHAQKVKLYLQLSSTCDGFGIPPEQCSGTSNFSPIFDNVRIRAVRVPNSPPLSFVTGCTFQDGFGQDQVGTFNPWDPGWADVTYDTRMGNDDAVSKQGDSMVVQGPVPATTTRWEAKLWLRLKRVGPGQAGNATYIAWKNAWIAARAIPFTPPQSLFTWGYMDSMEAAGQAAKNKFCSQFRDGPSPGGGDLPADLMYSWGSDTGEQDEGNEMIPDLALTPGTKVEYFITSNYICTPEEYFFLPDTSGGNFAEFEILPSYRMQDNMPKFPCLLWVDAYNRGSQTIIDNALNVVLNGASPGTPIPEPTTWDRFDYLDAASNWKAPFYREFGGNSGAHVAQLLGYHSILFHTGTFGSGCTWARDWQGIHNWMTAPICDGNIVGQSFIADGTAVGSIIAELEPSFLTEYLGAASVCPSYAELGCPPGEPATDENNCVRVNPVPGSPFGSEVIPTDVFGNWCPSMTAYGVLGPAGTGVGNKIYAQIGSGTTTEYAQIINDQRSGPFNYRSCINGFSSGQLTTRDPNFPNDPELECPSDSASRVSAALYELRNALRWTLNFNNLGTLGLCWGPQNCGGPGSIEEGASLPIDRLYPNHPNPFNPRTTIRFSLASAGEAKLVVFDVTGRSVRTLIDGSQTAGVHDVIWDGSDDAGRPVPSGVYWTRLSTDSFRSNRKMVVLK